MAELDIISLYNPTNEDITQTFNGEDYTLKSKHTQHFAKFVGYHIAKYLAIKMVNNTFSPKEHMDPKKTTQISQALVFDNPRLRIALYKILKSTDEVQNVILRYPWKGFVGEMEEYKAFVDTEEKRVAREKEKEEKESKPKEVKSSG